MKPISPRPIFSLYLFTTANQKIVKNSHFLAFSTQTQQSPVFRRHEEEGRHVRVSVWWDFENCNLPIHSNVFRVAQCITNAVRANGIKGPIQITAFGDVMQISRSNQEALSSTGINLTHVPAGGKNSADRSLLVDLMYWVSQNPPPAHLFLISGDRDFAGILHRLRMNNYNILLASPDSAPSVLCSSATIMWQWNSLLKGENLTGRLFNQPPDGPYNSWYGHYKAPLEDPFAISENSSYSNGDESSSSSEGRIRPIPKPVMKHIGKILGSYPDGIPITQLRAELAKSNLMVDKDFYGYKKFSRFLLSMPRVLKLESENDGQFLVRGVYGKFLDESSNGESETGFSESEKKSTVGPVQQPKDKPCGVSFLGLKTEEKRKEPFSPMKNGMEKNELDQKGKLKEPSKKVIESSKKISEENENQLLIPNEHLSGSGFGIFKRIWMKLFGSGDATEEKSSENDSVEDKSTKVVNPALFSPSSHEAIMYWKSARSDDGVANLSSVLSRAMSWFKFWSSPDLDDKEDKNSQILGKVEINPIFSNEPFWNEVEAFMGTLDGQTAFSWSRTRDHLVQNLRKYGPPILKSLPEGDLLQLIDLLISDKKWVEEHNSQAFPFKIIRPISKDTHPKRLHHMFLNLQEMGERKHQNPPHTGVAQPLPLRRSLTKPRNEVLADCQKLVDHIIKEHPEGFNIGSFRKLFIEKNGYPLDPQRLGYDKLVNLLSIMPGARIESNLIFPAGIFKNLDSQDCEKSDDSDSWDELGPVDKPDPNKEKTDLKKAQMGKDKQVLEYEPLDEYESDSEDEIKRPENNAKSGLKEEDSSLLEILGSWHSKEEGNNNEPKDNPLETKNEAPGPISPIRKQKHAKSYSFVIDEENKVVIKDKPVDGILGSMKTDEENKVVIKDKPVDGILGSMKTEEENKVVIKDKLVDGILGSLKKSTESKVPS